MSLGVSPSVLSSSSDEVEHKSDAESESTSGNMLLKKRISSLSQPEVDGLVSVAARSCRDRPLPETVDAIRKFV